MAITYTFMIDNIGYASIIAQSYCKRMRLRQNDQSVTTLYPYLVRIPFLTSTSVRREGGETYEIAVEGGPSGFVPSQVVGFITLANAGSVAFAQEEY